jgi:hypothetical protein
MMFQKPNKNQYPVYAIKSDDDEKPNKTNIRSYAVKSDDVPKANKPISLSMPSKAMMTKRPDH